MEENKNNKPLNNDGADNIEVIPQDFYGGVKQYSPGSRPLIVSGNVPVAQASPSGMAPSSNTSAQAMALKKINWQSPKVIIGAVAVILFLSVAGATIYYVRQAQLAKNRLSAPLAEVSPVAEVPVIPAPEAPVIPAPEAPVIPAPEAPVVAETAPTSTTAQAPTRPPTASVVAPARNYGKTADLDNDELTDVEEAFFKTDSQKPDTDVDGFADGLEVVSLFNPIGYKPVRLLDSGAVKIYLNPTYQYSIYYPVAWLAQALDANSQEVMFTADTGEFVEITVEDNPLKQSVTDWYVSKAQDVSTADLKSVTTKEGISGIYSPDNLVAYIPLEDKIYVINYNIGLRDSVNFLQTFKMMVNSFRTVGNLETEALKENGASVSSTATSTL